MSEFVSHINSFTSGEISNTLEGRFDLDLYNKSCRDITNMLVMEEGGATRRMGSLYMGSVKFHDKNTRIIPFKFSNDEFCMMELGDKYIRFWSSYGLIKDDKDKVVEVVTPYSAGILGESSDIYNLQWNQSGDVVYFVSKLYPPQKLTRKTDDYLSWDFEELEYKFPVFKDVNITDTTLTTVNTKDSKKVTASIDLFDIGQVGETWCINQPREDNQISKEKVTTAGTSAPIECEGQYNLVTHGVWGGTLTIERSEGNNVWTKVREFKSSQDFNVNYNGDEKFPDILYRLKWTNMTFDDKDTQLAFEFTVYENFRDVTFLIDEFVDKKNVKVSFTREIPVSDKPSKHWYQQAWVLEPNESSRNGYPNSITIFEERLFFGLHNKIWGSCTNDWTNFKTGTKDTDALFFTIPTADNVQWVIATRELLLGAEGLECSLGDNEENTPLTPSNIPKVKIESNNGCCNIRAQLFGDSVLYCQSHYRTINEFSFDWQTQKYNSPNLTLLARHITGEGIIDMCFSKKPQPILWCTRNDGMVIGLTYNRDQKIVAWHKQYLNGKVQCCAVIPFGYVNEDCLWVVVVREIEGVKKQYVERLSYSGWNKGSDAVFTDSTVSINTGSLYNIADIALDIPNHKITITCKEDTSLKVGDTVEIYQYGEKLDKLIIKDIEIVDKNTFKGNTFEEVISSKVGTCSCVTNTVTGLSHLEGEEVQALMDGGTTEKRKVSNGTVTFTEYGRIIHCGLPFTSKITPMPINIATSQGSTQPHPLRLTKSIVKFDKTNGCYLEVDGRKESIEWRTIYDKMGIPILGGVLDKEVMVASIPSRTLLISCIQEKPLPMTILNLGNYFNITSEA